MRQLIFDVNMQLIERNKSCDFSNIVRGSNNYLECLFMFDKTWDGYVKVANITDVSGNEYNCIVKDNRIVIPQEITQESVMYIKLIGKNKDSKIETNKCIIEQI